MSAAKVMRLAFPSDHEWWKRSTEQTYKAAAVALLAWGVSAEDAAELLSELYAAAASEFGA